MRPLLAPLGILFASILFAGTACASTLRVRLVEMAGFTRLIVDAGNIARPHIEHDGDQITIGLPPPGSVAFSVGRSRLLHTTSISSGTITYTFTQRVGFRQSVQAGKLWVDVFPALRMPEMPAAASAAPDASAASAAPDASAAPAALPTRTSGTLIPGLPSAFLASVVTLKPPTGSASGVASTRATTQSTPKAAPENDTTTRPEPVQEQLQASSVPQAGDISAALLPFSRDVGVAVLRHAHEAILFFDEARPLDLSPFRADAVLSGAAVSMHANATELRVPLDAASCIELTRQKDGWQLGVRRDCPDLAPVSMSTSGNELRFRLKAPGRVIDAIDPVTGAYLLVGTDRLAQNAVKLSRRSSTFILDRTDCGVIVEPILDRLTLRPVQDGFSLARDDARSFDARTPDPMGDAPTDPSGLTRSLDIETTSLPALIERLQAQLLTAATVPERARLQPRLAAAQTMLALGLVREARSLTRVAFADDPLAGSDPKALLVRALCEFLDDPKRADLLQDPALPSSEEVRLWRALALANDPATLEARAAAIRAGLPLLLAYPKGLRDAAAGLAAPVLFAHAAPADRDALAALPRIPATVIEQVLAGGEAGRRKAAIAQLDLLARDRDLGVSSAALLGLLPLEVADGRLQPSQAADLLDRHRLDFRAVGREADGMLAEARLRRQSNQFAQAFALWQDVAARFPGRAAEARLEVDGVLRRLADPAVAKTMTAADFVTVVTQSTPELVTRPDLMARLAPLLADRFEQLDLPARAAGVLRQLVAASPPTSVKARLGNKLAELLLDQGETGQAQQALDQSAAPDLPGDVAEARRLTSARILDQSGEHAQALAALADDRTDASRELRANIEVALGRWHEAKLDYAELAVRLPKSGALGRDDGELAIRLATAASRDNDLPLLTSLSRSVAGRFTDAAQQETFGLLTSSLLPDAVASAGRGG